MTNRLICPLGHHWNGASSSPCPECGASGRVELALTALDLGTRVWGVPLTQVPDGAAEAGGPVPTVAGCEVLGELARGGMGIVYRAHDTALDRDLALKILRAEHAGEPDLRQRFLEEAQVGGQLQHPGIVPVYHVGAALDGRPCFTMKLVQGRTLGNLLRGRANVAEEQGRFLTIFEQICQAVAYAHDHGVVHRDLKPDNVMVGAFGEVLVMDWGLAKVLDWAQRGVRTVRTLAGSLPSESGSVLGTPAYMAPEQARGETAALDERADVFGLGAILCEILTGAPPYVGATSGEVALLAAQADLTQAHDHLAACGADEGLITLARECLEVDREKRPRDAGLVAVRIVNYRAALLERSAQAVVEKEMIRREQEQQAVVVPPASVRGMLIPVCICGLALLLVTCLGWFREVRQHHREAAARQEENDKRANERRQATEEDLRKLEDLRREGRLAAAWEALARAEGRGDEGLVVRVFAARAELQRDEQARALLDRLDAIPAQSPPHGVRPTAAAALYGQAFASYGLEIEGDAPANSARAVQASPLGRRLVAALDAWARAAEPEMADRLRAVAALADADPWQRRVRTANADGDATELQRLAAAPEAMTPTGALLLAEALDRADEPGAALALLRAAQRRHPSDLALAWTLAARLVEAAPGGASAEAIRLLTLAVGLAPDSVPLRLDLANALVGAGLADEALENVQAAVRLQPANVESCRRLAEILVHKGRYAEALEVLNEATVRARIDNETRDRVARLVLLEEQLPSFRSGKREVTEAATAADLGRICQSKDLAAAAAGFYTLALRLDPKGSASLRPAAARAAVRAGCGQGADAPRGEVERARLRRLAMTWLSDEVTACAELQASRLWGSKVIIASRARALLNDADLVAVRAPDQLAALSEQERTEWVELWHEFGALWQYSVKPR